MIITNHSQILPDALYVINHSGGKDSQAMYLFLKDLIPAEQLVVIHANLPGVEWEGVIDHIKATIDTQHPLYVVAAGKTFLEMVEKRGMFPSSSTRQCTSDLKRDPICKEVRRIATERGFSLIVNCTGIRAQESTSRAAKSPWKLNKRESNSLRSWYEWMPIFTWSEVEVRSFVQDHGQQLHWAYSQGMSRLSCCFCIMAKKSDLQIAARLNPELFQRFVELEKKIGHTFISPKKDGTKISLEEYLAA